MDLSHAYQIHFPSQRLQEEGEILILTRFDKEEILFYNNREFEISIDEGEQLILPLY